MSSSEFHKSYLGIILESLPVGLSLSAMDNGQVVYANARFREIYGDWCKGEFTDLETLLEKLALDQGDPELLQKRILENLESHNLPLAQVSEIRIPGADGNPRIVSVRSIPLPDLNLNISTVQDVTEQKLIEQNLRQSERRYQLMAETSPVGIYRLSPGGSYRHVNKAWREITGLIESQVLGMGWDIALHPEDKDEVMHLWEVASDLQRPFKTECRFRRPEGRSVWVFLQTDPIVDSQGHLEGFVGSVTDISLRKRSEEEIRQLAYYDTLTKLPNRSFFMEQLERAMAAAHRGNTNAALLFCDLDSFKDVNDSLGHDMGDLLLQQIASRLNSCIRRGDTLSRLGGDEFVLLLPNIADAREAATVARKIQQSLVPAFDLGGHQVYSRASIGIAVYPEDGTDVQTLLKHADTAMYAAKNAGRNRYRFFSEEMNRRNVARMRVEAGLRQAIGRKELSLAWQPQYDLNAGSLIGVEALLRWNSAELGVMPPASFIPLAEETGLIHEIGAWVLEEACQQMQQWRRRGSPPLRVAVNLSASQFREPDIADQVRDVLDRTGLDPAQLELEITESVLMGDGGATLRTLKALREDGVGLAIDDFGTGYSSLAYLKKLPVGRIKIAREFVRDITTDPHDAAIAGTVISMARNLSMQAIAEGVETREQADCLRALQCPEVQGFFFCRPVHADEFSKHLALD
nr:EAL domain-containing protein [Candidatus Krumholzibacteria bacterium]